MISFYVHNSQMAKHAIKWRGKNINLDQTRKKLERLQAFLDFTHFAYWFRLYSFSLRSVFQN